jgi:hypothetical protein
MDHTNILCSSIQSFRRINAIFRTDHYDIWYSSIQSFRRINTVFWTDHYNILQRSFRQIITIFGTDQYNLPGGSIRSIEWITTIFQADHYNLWYGSIWLSYMWVITLSTVCVSATSTRNLTFLAQITCHLQWGEKCKISHARCYIIACAVYVCRHLVRMCVAYVCTCRTWY